MASKCCGIFGWPQRDARALRKGGPRFPVRLEPSARVKAVEVLLEFIQETLGHPAEAAVEADLYNEKSAPSTHFQAALVSLQNQQQKFKGMESV